MSFLARSDHVYFKNSIVLEIATLTKTQERDDILKYENFEGFDNLIN